MDLNALLEIGRMSGDIVTQSVTYRGNTFDVNIKKEMSGADFEFIYASGKNDDGSIMSRRVSRLILVGEKSIAYEEAKKFKHSFLVALCNAINAVQDADVKKT
jgi:hypothetical protein